MQKRLTVPVFISFFLIVTMGCNSFHERPYLRNQTSSDKTVEELYLLAEVKWVPLEGGFYGIVAEDGKKFLPLNLPDTFRKDGLKVKIRGTIKEVITIYMWGTPIQIHEIEIFNP